MSRLLSRIAGKGYRLINNVCRAAKMDSAEALMDDEIEEHIKLGKQTILYVAPRYDYGNRKLGLGYPYYNCYHTLRSMDYSLVCFDTDRIAQRYSCDTMSRMLREAVYYYQPDIMFYLHYKDYFSYDILREIADETPTQAVYWQSDDHFQYEATRGIWELFNFVVTTDRKGYERRLSEGHNNTILSQYACNHFLYKDLLLPRMHNVSFVGRNYGSRQEFVDSLRRSGVVIDTFGPWWGKGGNSQRVTQTDLLRILNQTKITLDLSLASGGNRNIVAVKGRDFEATGCGSMLLTEDSEEIGEYFIPGEEIVTYHDAKDAADKIKYYLEHEDKRSGIAERGYQRTLKDHTWAKRFTDIFALVFKGESK